MTLKVLVIEDDYEFREPLCDLLNLEGFAAVGVGSLGSYRAWRQTQQCDVMIVDRVLPDGDGLEAVKEQKLATHTEAIIISAFATTNDRVEGFEADVDHYLKKPIESVELLSILRRIERKHSGAGRHRWLLDVETWTLKAPTGTEIKLTKNEVAFLACFVERSGIPVNRQDLVDGLGFSVDSYDIRRMEILVRRLRRKVSNADAELPLQTVYG